jgi:phage shock protein A
VNNFKEVLRQRQEIESSIEALKSSLEDASQSYDKMADRLESFNIPRET